MTQPPATATDIAALTPKYRAILKRELPARYLKPDNLHLLWLIPHGIAIGVCLWVMARHFQWSFAPILALVIGHSFGCLGFVAHETCHGGAIKDRRLRDLLTAIAFSPFGVGPHVWNRWHNAEHHGHTQNIHLDPDRLFHVSEYRNRGLLYWLHRVSPVLRNIAIFSFFSLLMTVHNIAMMVKFLRDPETTGRSRWVIALQFLAPKSFWIGLTLINGWPVLLMGYVLPLLVANAMVISYIATNHFLNPLADESDVLAGSLSVTLPRWLGWLDIAHCRFGAHVAHHLFPTAPSRHARKIERHVARLWPDRFHTMQFRQALKLLWKTPWVYGEDGQRLVDPRRQVSTPTLGNGL